MEAIMLEYLNPNHPFNNYPDASSTHVMGAVLEQDGKIVSTFLRKFNNAQLNSFTAKSILAGEKLVATYSISM